MGATASSGDSATHPNDRAEKEHQIQISGGTVQIHNTHLSGPGLPTASIEHQAFTIDSSTVHIDGVTLTIDGHTQTVGQTSITMDNVGIVLEDVSTSST
ncbi:hypothetical protein BG842_03570 [Haladaptatus sp. W1]|nr:hypothetical protein BG842_03570 [Haladaptatus sp. W1]